MGLSLGQSSSVGSPITLAKTPTLVCVLLCRSGFKKKTLTQRFSAAAAPLCSPGRAACERREAGERLQRTFSPPSSSPQQEELSEDAADAPHVHREHVDGVEQHLRSSVPQRHHLSAAGGVRLPRQRRANDGGLTYAGGQSDVAAVDARQAEVCDLHLPAAAHEDVLRLQVAVHHQAGVQEFQPPQQLPHDVLQRQQSPSSCLKARIWIFIRWKNNTNARLNSRLKSRFFSRCFCLFVHSKVQERHLNGVMAQARSRNLGQVGGQVLVNILQNQSEIEAPSCWDHGHVQQPGQKRIRKPLQSKSNVPEVL